MLSPEARAAAHRLIAILIALINALAAPAEGDPRPLLNRLAARALAAGLTRLRDHLTQLATAPTDAPPAATPPAPRPPSIPRTPTTPPEPPPLTRRPAAAARAPLAEISLPAAPPTHARFVPRS